MNPYTIITETIVDLIISKVNLNNSPLSIVVTGDSGSGKSYYSELIQNELDDRGIKFTYINADDFLIPRADRELMKKKLYKSGKFKGKSYYEILENMFYLDKFKKVINDLKEREPSTYFPYLRSTGEISTKSITKVPEDILIYDSSMLLELFDMKILIEVSMENILARKVARDKDIRTAEEVIEMHNKVQGYYWERKKPDNPDVVIDNNDTLNPKLVKV